MTTPGVPGVIPEPLGEEVPLLPSYCDFVLPDTPTQKIPGTPGIGDRHVMAMFAMEILLPLVEIIGESVPVPRCC